MNSCEQEATLIRFAIRGIEWDRDFGGLGGRGGAREPWWKGDPSYGVAGTRSPSNPSALFCLPQAPHTITAPRPEELPRLQPPLPTTVTDPQSQAGAKHLSHISLRVIASQPLRRQLEGPNETIPQQSPLT